MIDILNTTINILLALFMLISALGTGIIIGLVVKYYFKQRGITMTSTQFQILCGKYLIDVEIALENENILNALRNKDDEEVERILTEEF